MNTRWLLPMILGTLLTVALSTALFAQDAAPPESEAAKTTAPDDPAPEVPDKPEPAKKPPQQPAPKYSTDQAVEEIRSAATEIRDYASHTITWSTIVMAIGGAFFTAVVVILLVKSVFETRRIKREITEAIQEGRESAREAKQDVRHVLGDAKETLKEAKDHVREIREMKESVAEDTKRAEAAAVSTEKKVDATSELFKAQSAYERQDYDSAIAAYTKAINVNPAWALLWHNRGVAKDEKGDHDGAIADYDEAIRLDPNDAVVWNNRGVTKGNKRDYDGAIADYDEAIRLGPDQLDAVLNNRGVAKNKKGDYNGAIADHDEAIRLNPNKAIIRNNRGVAKRNKGDFDGAILDCDEAGRLEPELARPRQSKLVTLFCFCDRARWQKAGEFLKDLWPFMKTDPDRLIAEYIAAFVFTLLGKASDAKKARGNMTDLLDKGIRDPDFSTQSFVKFVKECKLVTAKQRTFLREVNKQWLEAHGKK